MADLRKALEKKVILIGNTKSFMVNSVIKGLIGVGFEVVSRYASVEAVSDVTELIKTYVLFMDDSVTEEFLVYLRDAIDDKDICLFIIGNPAELDLCYKTIPEVKIEESFKRPLNISDLVDSLEKTIEEQTSRSNKKKILVVDDDGTMLRTIKTWLEEKYNVYMANSGVNAITFLAKNQVDLVLLDYEMPVADGPTVLGMIRHEPQLQTLPVMFLTAKSDKESVMKVLNLSPNKYLLKTMPPKELVAEIDKFFREQKYKTTT